MGSLEDLKEKLLERKVIPFVGAGVSMNIHDRDGKPVFPSWKDLLRRAVEKLRNADEEAFANLVNDQLENKNDYLGAAKYARDGLKGDWNDFLDKQFNPRLNEVPESSFEIARLIWQLGSQLVITTNYDKVLRWKKENVATWDIEAKFQQGKVLRDGLSDEPTVWHLHGYIDNPSDIILTPNGYKTLYPIDSNAAVKYAAALTTLRTLFIPYSFLFIGFSLEDSRFTDQIRQINELFDGAAGHHFALVKESDKNRVESLGLPIKVVTYEDHGLPLLELLRKLIEGVGDSGPSEETYIPPPKSADYSPEKPAFYVPFKSKGDGVIGREDDLESVRKSLLSGKPTRIGQAVLFEGMGGLGKTQLAVEYAYKYRHADEYKNGVIWITVDQDIDKQLIELAEKSAWISPQSESKDKLAVAVHRLKTITNSLIIFDNIESLDEIKDYLPDSTENNHLLATSRKELGVFIPVSINVLSLDQSVEMLKRESGRKLETDKEIETAEQIAENLGRLPLALELAGAYLLNRTNVSWEEYLELLRTNPKSVFLDKFRDSSFTDHDADVYRTLKISEDLLSEDLRLGEILDLLTWSGSSPMGISLMCGLLAVDRETDLTNALSLGVKLRFLQEAPNRKAYAIHRLVAQVRREDIPLEERMEWVATVSQRLGNWFQDRREDFSKLSEYESEVEHLTAWQRHSLMQAPDHASRLLWLQAYPPYHLGKYKESFAFIEEARRVYIATDCKNRAVLAHILNDLGYAASYLGNLVEELGYQEKALDIRLELYGESHYDTATSYSNLGSAYGNLGEYGKQLEFTQKALDIQIDLFGERHRDTATSYGNLGGAYGNLGEYEKQLEFTQKALDIEIELFGEAHPNTATSYGNLGSAYRHLGKYLRQLEFTQKALNIQIELFGEKHPDTAVSYGNLGNAYGNLGEYKKELELTRKSLDIKLELFGEKRPDTATTYSNLGSAYGNLGQYEKQLEFTQKALNLRLDLFGENHPDTSGSYSNFGVTYGNLRDIGKQLQFTQKALVIQIKLFGKKHPSTATSYSNLASVYADMHKYDQAIEMGYESLSVRKERLGRIHPQTLISLNKLIRFLVDNPRRDKFFEMRAKAQALTNEFLQSIPRNNPEHEKLLQTQKWIEDSFHRKGLHAKQKKRHKKK